MPNENGNPATANYPEVVVSGGEFFQSVKLIGLAFKKGQGEIRFDYDGTYFLINGPGTTAKVKARGKWNGSAYVNGQILKELGPRFPKDESLSISYRNDRLTVGHMGISARWQDIGGTPILTAMGHTPIDVLLLDKQYGREALMNSGMIDQLIAAKLELDSRVAEAAKALEMYRITPKFLYEAVQLVLDVWSAEAKIGKKQDK